MFNKDKFIPISAPSLTNLEREHLIAAYDSGWISSLGEYITKFEKSFADYVGVSYALTVSNGTVGLHLALLALGISSGDEVIIPALTFVATANAIKYMGATPVLVDIDPVSLCLDEGQLQKAITNKTKAVIPVHLYGHPANMARICDIAQKAGIHVVEDAAEAHGAKIDNQIVGSWGSLGVFSFYGNKIITTGEGGIITTNDRDLYQKIKSLRDHAMSPTKRYWHETVGYNYRMTNMQAAIGYAQLLRIEEILLKKQQIYHWYKDLLRPYPSLLLNQSKANVSNVYWLICVQIQNCSENERDLIISQLDMKGIGSRPFFYPLHKMPMYKNLCSDFDIPITIQVSSQGINLPSFYDITHDEVKRVVDTMVLILSDMGKI